MFVFRGDESRLCLVSVLCQGLFLSLLQGLRYGPRRRIDVVCGRSLLVRPTPPAGEVGVPCGPVIRIALPLVLLAPQGVCGIVREVLCGVQ